MSEDQNFVEAVKPDETDVGLELSKNQRKRLLKQEKWKEEKLCRRAAKKEKEKLKREAARSALREAPTIISSADVMPRDHAPPRRSRSEVKEEERQKRVELCMKSFSIIIDCNWESIHAERPLISLSQQILFCYGVNNRAVAPSLVYLTGVGPRLQTQLNKSNVSKWVGIACSPDEYSFPRHESKEVVYLTSDAEETLTELNVNTAYIIGGIVDRNAHKGVTFAKAREQGIRSAKLPIKEYCGLKSSTVLTVNQIFDIMLKFAETQDWAMAIRAVIPLRKQLQNDDAGSDEELRVECDLPDGFTSPPRPQS